LGQTNLSVVFGWETFSSEFTNAARFQLGDEQPGSELNAASIHGPNNY